MPFSGLTQQQLVVAQALARSPRWRPRSGLCALRADGALIEMGTSTPWPRDTVPFLPDEVCLGHLLALLVEACGSRVTPEFGTRSGGRAYCTLRADGGHERTWEGELLAEAVGAALVARWAALDGTR